MTEVLSIPQGELLERTRKLHESMRAWRRTIHRYPELSFTEERTAALVRGVLGDLGIPCEAGVAKTGVVGHIVGNARDPVIGLRADMDALPITEINGSDFDSTRPGLMHACGHDAHTAMLLGAATVLKELADEGGLPGGIRLLFQPSEEAWDEEGKSGGRRMVEEGALEGLAAVFGLHVEPRLEVGRVSTREGPLLAAVDSFELVIRGVGGHAAEPHLARDPIAMAGLVINAVHQVISRHLNPIESGVITIGTIHGGSATNIIDTQVTMTGTIRSMTPEIRRLLHDELRGACRLVEALGGNFELTIEEGYPVTVNAPEATQAARQALTDLLGEERVHEAPPTMGSEDFSYMAQAVPGCFVLVGVRDPTWDRSYPVHTPTFRIDEEVLPVGAATLAATALEWMRGDG